MAPARGAGGRDPNPPIILAAGPDPVPSRWNRAAPPPAPLSLEDAGSQPLDSASETTSAGRGPRACTFCGLVPDGRPAQCPRCGSLIGAAADDLKREGDRRRRELGGRKAVADLLFLAGLLIGGPLLSFDLNARLGLFLILGGGLASTARRYTSWSTPGTVIVGGLLAAVVAAAVIDPGEPGAVEADAAGRAAYVDQLGQRLLDEGIYVEARGPAGRIVWFYVPSAAGTECGDVPSPEARRHLADVGVRRVVVAGRESREGLCSIVP